MPLQDFLGSGLGVNTFKPIKFSTSKLVPTSPPVLPIHSLVVGTPLSQELMSQVMMRKTAEVQDRTERDLPRIN